MATVIPGAFNGWMLLPRDFGTMRLDYVFNLAIYHAETARPLVREATLATAGLKEFFEAERLTSAAMWLPVGVGPEAGENFFAT